MKAINDSLDEEVNVAQYKRPEIKKIFQHIEKNMISPQERAKMKDEYSFRLLEQEAKEKGIKKGKDEEKKNLAKKLLSKSYSVQEIAELTELSLEQINNLSVEG